MAKTRVMVGLSGGVDSAVAALRLKQMGYEVHGLFMKNWEEDDEAGYCSAAEDLEDVEAVARVLDIPVHTRNFSGEYWDHVFEHFLDEYKAGRTPNPDILCNKEIKFKTFLEHAVDLGAEYIATGHYVRKGEDDTGLTLLKGLDGNKDQSYFLYTLQQHQLAKALFPIGDLPKPEVRRIAQEAGLIVHDKKDSTGICFIGERKFRDFLKRFIPAQPGKMETPDGQVVGEHIGLMYYTIGQRKGLGIGGRKDFDDTPWFSLEKDLERNVLIVGQGHDHPLLFKNGLIASKLDWVQGHPPKLPHSCRAKTRYRQADQDCTLTALDNGQLKVNFAKPQRAITPGQSVVFYDADTCLGGGVIEEAFD